MSLMKHAMEPDKLKKHYWVWPIAWYLFLGGLGGGMLFVIGLMDIVFGVSYLLAPGALIAVACLGIGSLLLIFELGQPKVFLRVFLSATAIIKWGAILLIGAMLFGFLYFLFWLPPEWNLFWYSWEWMHLLSTSFMMLLGLGVVIYTGVLLCTMKAKPFWNTPALPVLFTLSALSTATACLALTGLLWNQLWMATLWFGEMAGSEGFLMELTYYNEFIVSVMHGADTFLIVAESIVLLLYVLLMRASGNVTAKAIALDWIVGSKAFIFWGALMGCGLAVPFGLYLFGGFGAVYIAPVLVLLAGLVLRFLIVYSDQRRVIPGEERFYARMPKGDERYLQGWKAPY